MTVWLAFAVMTAAAIFAVLVPLGRARDAAAAPAGSGSEVAVYKDQLAELERDLAGGLIGPAEAEAARVEISRRLIAAAGASPASASASAQRRRAAALAALVGVPLVAFAAYGWRGQPDYPAQPLAERSRPEPGASDMAMLVGRVEAHLRANPEDGRGWEVVAPVYQRLGRIDDAVRARANALRILGSTSAREADLAEVLVMQAQGVVTAEAKAAFERAAAADPDNFKARFFLGLAADQDGKADEARAIWSRMVEAAPPGAPWLGLVRGHLARLNAASPPPAGAAPPGNIVAMVDGLAARLAADGSDFEGWLRLVRSYAVLGEADKARQAAADARRRFADETEKTARIDALLRELGLGG